LFERSLRGGSGLGRGNEEEGETLGGWESAEGRETVRREGVTLRGALSGGGYSNFNIQKLYELKRSK
jgi:hypothetical protein